MLLTDDIPVQPDFTARSSSPFGEGDLARLGDPFRSSIEGERRMVDQTGVEPVSPSDYPPKVAQYFPKPDSRVLEAPPAFERSRWRGGRYA